MFFLFFLRRINSKNKKAFFLYTLVITILVLAVVITRYIYLSYESYYLVVRIYNVLEYSLLSYLFYLYIRSNVIRKLLLFSVIPYTLFCIYDFISTKESTLSFAPIIVEYIVLLVFIIYFFFEVMQHSIIEPIYHKAIFWISVAFILNFSGNFFLFLYSLNSYDDELFKKQYTLINSAFIILKNILLCISILIKEKNDTPASSNHFEVDLDSFHPINSRPKH